MASELSSNHALHDSKAGPAFPRAIPWVTGMDVLEKPTDAEVIGIALTLFANLTRTQGTAGTTVAPEMRTAPLHTTEMR